MNPLPNGIFKFGSLMYTGSENVGIVSKFEAFMEHQCKPGIVLQVYSLEGG